MEDLFKDRKERKRCEEKGYGGVGRNLGLSASRSDGRMNPSAVQGDVSKTQPASPDPARQVGRRIHR